MRSWVLTSSPNGPPRRLWLRASLPNLLTASRLALAPFVVRAILRGQFREAMLLVAVAGLTDVLDGGLARWLGAASRLGAYLDPVADKVLLSATYLAGGLSGLLPWWLVAIVFGRDVLILAGAVVAWLLKRRRDFSPSMWGKLSTFIQALTAASVLLARGWPETGLEACAPPLVWLTAAATLWSGLDYARRALRPLHPAFDGRRT